MAAAGYTRRGEGCYLYSVTHDTNPTSSTRTDDPAAGATFGACRRFGDGPPRVGVIMGSQSDWETMRHACETLVRLGVAGEASVVSAHRTPDVLFAYASAAAARGLAVIIAGAGGAAHLPGMCASKTTLPVLGVPVESRTLRGVDSLLSIVQMPAGVAVGTMAIGKAGAINAGLLAAQILALHDAQVRGAVNAYREAQTSHVLGDRVPRDDGAPGGAVR